MTALCNTSLWACFLADPIHIFNIAMGGVAFLGLAIIFPYLLWKALHERPHPR